MKAIVLILAGALGMTGCTTMDNQGNGRITRYGQSSHSTSPDPCIKDSSDITKQSGNTDPRPSPCHDGKVPVLDPTVEKIVGKTAGVEHIAAIFVIGRDGKQVILRPNSAIRSGRVDLEPGRLVPAMRSQEIHASAIKGMGSISMLSFRGSDDCYLWMPSGPGGQGVKTCLMPMPPGFP